MPEYTEPEEKGGFFSPLDEKVNEKPYSKLNVQADAEALNRPIAEPTFTPPPMDSNFNGDKSQHQKGGSVPKSQQQQQEAFNPSMNEIPNAEKAKASKHVAAMIMQGYDFANQLANKGLMFSEKRLMKLQQDGEVDFNTTYIPYDMSGNVMPAVEFIKEYNAQQEGAFKVTDEFKQEVTPVLERVLEKRGVGMTDEQFLMYMFGKDIAMKGFMFVSARAQMNQMIQLMKEANQQGNTAHRTPPPPPPSGSTYSPEPEDTGTYSFNEDEDIDLDDFQTSPPPPETVNDEVERMTNPEGYAAKQSQQTPPAGKKKVGRKPKNK